MDDQSPQLVTVQPVSVAVIGGTVAMADLRSFFDTSFTRLAQVLSDQGVQVVTPAFALYHGPPGETVDLEVGFGTDRPVATDGDVRAGERPGGQVARLEHAGSYDDLGMSWERLAGWVAEQGQAPGEVLWEAYLTEPTPDMDPAELRTELTWTLQGPP